MWKADRRLWLTADKERVVEDGDPEAAFLLAAGPDDLVSEEDARRYGLSERKADAAPKDEAKPVEAEEPKMAEEETPQEEAKPVEAEEPKPVEEETPKEDGRATSRRKAGGPVEDKAMRESENK